VSDALSGLFVNAIDDARLVYAKNASVRTALESFQGTLSDREHPFLASLCCSIEDLSLLGQYLLERPDSPAIGVCVFGSQDPAVVRDRKFGDLNKMNLFRSQCGDRAEVTSYSVELPRTGDVESFYDDLRGFATTDVEVRIRPDCLDPEEAVAYASEREWLSLAFEMPLIQDAVAAARNISQCAGLEVPFRVLGLQGNLVSGNPFCGALNALSAGVLAFVEDLSEREIYALLTATDPTRWKTDASGIRFDDYSASASQVYEARTVVAGISVVATAQTIHEYSEFLGRKAR
jgi:hypothetical protein